MKDFKIRQNDLTLDAKHELVYLQDEHAIAQDLSHRLRISGLTEKMIGEQNHQDIQRKIQLELEKDKRIEAGTVEIQLPSDKKGGADVQQIRITAKLKSGAVVKI